MTLSASKVRVLAAAALKICTITIKPNDGLALALFVLWILTNDSDATFSFDNFAFLADRFYRRSNLHDESSFLCSLAPRVGEFSVVNFWNAFSFCGLEKSPRAKVRFIV